MENVLAIEDAYLMVNLGNFKKFIFALTFLLPIFVFGVSAAEPSFSYDDRSSVFTYSGRSTYVVDEVPLYDQTLSSITAGSQSLSFDFYGSSLELYGARARYSSCPVVFVDGVQVSNLNPNSYSTVLTYAPIKWFTIDSLEEGKHHCVIFCDPTEVLDAQTGRLTTPRFYFDYAVFDYDLDTEPVKFSLFWVPFFGLTLLVSLYILIKSVFWRLNYDD